MAQTPRIIVTLDPLPGEREVVHQVLGTDAAWLMDEPDVSGADVVVPFFPRRELRAAGLAWTDFPALRLIQVATAGLNHLDWDNVPSHVQVANAPGSSAPAIAEYVLGAVIAWARGLTRHTQAIRAGRFPLGAPVRALGELRVGLVGYGGIGQEVARVFGLFGAAVRAVSRSGRADGEARDRVERLARMDRLAELAAWADVLVVCIPLHQDTVGRVAQPVLAAFDGDGRDRLLVNVARGPVVAEDALHDWLSSDPVGHAAVLDVWWHYPPDGEGHPFTQPFHELPNVVMTPHNSPNVTGFRTAMLAQACRQVRHYLNTGEAQHVQDREAHAVEGEGDGR